MMLLLPELVNLLQGLPAGAFADREHGHDAADAEHDAQHRQEGPQLVEQEILQAGPDVPNDLDTVPGHL